MIKNYSTTHRESLLSVLGAPPDLCPLEPQVLSVEQLDGYRREKVSYWVQPNERVNAYLLIPEGDGTPLPAVFCHHRHNQDWSLGKSEVVGLAGDPDEAIGAELVKRGYVVIAPDAISFEERRLTPTSGSEHNFHELAVRLLRGETLLKKVIWDASRALDYLETRPEVNPRLLGFMGHGYGGLMGIWVSAMDERITATVAHGQLASMHAQLRHKHPIQIEFAVPRLLQVADYDRIIGLSAPRPMLLSCLKNDPSTLEVETLYLRVQKYYERLGMGNRLGFYHYDARPDARPLPIEARHHAYTWLDTWLKPY